MNFYLPLNHTQDEEKEEAEEEEKQRQHVNTHES